MTQILGLAVEELAAENERLLEFLSSGPVGLVELVASRSYVIALPDAERSALLSRVRAVAHDLAREGPVDLPYLTMTLRCERLRE